MGIHEEREDRDGNNTGAQGGARHKENWGKLSWVKSFVLRFEAGFGHFQESQECLATLFGAEEG